MVVGRVRTGVILIALGVLLLLNTTGMLHVGFWGYIWRLWPVLLIAIGLEKIFASSDRLRPLAWLSPLVIIGVVAYAVVAGNGDGNWNSWDNWNWQFNSDDTDGELYTWSEALTPSSNRLSLQLQMSSGRLVVRGGTGTGNLVEGRITYYRGEKPHVKSDQSGGTYTVEVDDRGRSSRHGRDQWILKVSDSLPVQLTVAGGATRARLDLTAIKLESLTMSAAASEVDLTLGSLVRSVDCRISCAAASVDVTVPTAAGVRVEHEGALSNFSSGNLDLAEHGNVMETPGFDSKPVQIRLRIDSGVSSVRLNGASGTDGGSAI